MKSPLPGLLACLALASCAYDGGKSTRSALAPPANYSAYRTGNFEPAPSLLALFGDARLKKTVALALAHNPDLKSAASVLREAGFNFEKSRSSLFPSLSGNAGASRQKSAATTPAGSFSAGLDAAWEVDLWGRIRAGVNASGADLAAARADYADARQSLAAQTMQAWFSLVATEKSLALDEERVSSFSGTHDSVKRRYELGKTSHADVDLALTDLENARADLESSRDLRNQAARRLEVLTGRAPTGDLRAGSWPSLRQAIPAGLPSDLLRDRPDILAAYARLRAADERVQVAHADLFPSFSLTASGGRGSATLSGLANSSFSTWSLLANLSGPLYDAGERLAERDAARERAEQAFQSYQSSVLNALEEVENALGSELALAREESRREAALKAAREASERTRRNYEAGVDDILTLLTAQRRVFTTEQDLIRLRQARLNNRVSLALALGKAY